MNNKFLAESKVIRNRFGVILKSSFNKKNHNKLFDNILKEMIQLYSKGYNQKLISENVENVFNVFSNITGLENDKVMETFKERGVQFIVDNLKIDNDSMLKEYIKTSLNKTSINDVPKLFTNCTYLTKKISESIVEHYLDDISNKNNMGEDFNSSISSALSEVISNSDFAEKIEPKILGIICPLVDRMNGIFDSKLNDMKTKLMSSNNNEDNF